MKKGFFEPLSKLLLSRKGIGIIFLIALLIRILFITTYADGKFLEEKFYAADEDDYDQIALNLLTGEGLSYNQRPSLDAPVYPAFLAFIYSFFGYSLVKVRFFQALLGALMCLFIFQLGKKLFSEKVGLLSALIVALYYPLIHLSGYLMTEALFIFLCVVSVFLITKALEEKSRGKFLLAGILFGLASLCRYVLVPFIILFTGLLLLGALKILKDKPLRALSFSLAFLLGVSVIFTPWIYRNYKVTGQLVPQGVGHLIFLAQSNSPYFTGGRGGWVKSEDFKTSPVYPESSNKFKGVERIKEFRRISVNFIFKEPGSFLRLLRKKFINMWRPFHSGTSLTGKIVNGISYSLVILFAIVGIFYTFPAWRRLWAIYFFILYYIFLHLIVMGAIRYRYPVMPFLIIFAAQGFIYFQEKILETRLLTR